MANANDEAVGSTPLVAKWGNFPIKGLCGGPSPPPILLLLHHLLPRMKYKTENKNSVVSPSHSTPPFHSYPPPHLILNKIKKTRIIHRLLLNFKTFSHNTRVSVQLRCTFYWDHHPEYLTSSNEGVFIKNCFWPISWESGWMDIKSIYVPSLISDRIYRDRDEFDISGGGGKSLLDF